GCHGDWRVGWWMVDANVSAGDHADRDQLSSGRDSLRDPWRHPRSGVFDPVRRCGAGDDGDPRNVCRDGRGAVAFGDRETLRVVRTGRVRRWICRPELRRLLVLLAVGHRAGHARPDLLWREYSGGILRARRVASGGPVWSHPDHGVDALAVERPVA